MKKFIILIPIFNDWDSLKRLISEINKQIAGIRNAVFNCIVVNDASTISRPKISKPNNFSNFKIMNMRVNKGHARCNAFGIRYVKQNEEFDYLILMDGDGEDRPEEIRNFIQLSEQSSEKSIIGERVKRSEGLFFQLCYQFHKLLTLAFTGHSIKFGNFTCLPKSTVKKLLEEKATWNSFSGSLKKIEKDLISIPSTRGKRYFGPSQMSFFNLLKHSLSIISVFRKTVLIRSALFIIFYILIIKSYASVITSLPLVLLLIMIYSISSLALRENIDEFNNSLTNIHDIDKIK